MKTELKFNLSNIINNLRGTMGISEFKYNVLVLLYYKYLSDNLLDETVNYAGKSLDEFDTQEKISLYQKLLLNVETESDLIAALVENLGYYIEPCYLFYEFAEQAKHHSVQMMDFKIALHYLAYYKKFDDLFCEIDIDRYGGDEKAPINDIIEMVTKLCEMEPTGSAGKTYELLMKHFALLEAKSGQCYYTPHEISDVMAQIAALGNENRECVSVYDPVMGSASLLVHIQNYMAHPEGIRYYGEEIHTAAFHIARMNLAVHGVKNSNMSLHNGDILCEDWFRNERFDVVLMDPPFSNRWSADWTFLYDARFCEYGRLAPKSRADFAFLLHGLSHLKDSGTMAAVLPQGVLFRSGAEADIRSRLLSLGNIDAVIGLPQNVFFSTALPAVIIILKKHRSERDVLFIDASRDFNREKNKNKLTEEGIRSILDAYKNRQDIDKYAYVASYEEIVKNDYNLNISRYVNLYSNIIEDTGRCLTDVADIIAHSDAIKTEGIFISSKDLRYPLNIKENVRIDYGIELKRGDIIVFRSGRKYLYYENMPNIYLLVNQPSVSFIIRPEKICPEALFLYLETEEVTNYLFDMSGSSYSNIQEAVLEKLPISKELPPITAHKKNKPYINLFEEKYYTRAFISDLSSLFQTVQIKITENTSNNQLARECISLIETGEEGIYWDFKLKHHKNKARLLHDMICMANNIADRDAYIIIGVEDKTGRVAGVEHDENRKDTTHFHNILKTAAFFADITPAVHLETIIYKNHEIDILVIEYIPSRPFYLVEDYRDKEVVVRKNAIYARESDSNTDIDKSASVRAVEHLWQERFTTGK